MSFDVSVAEESAKKDWDQFLLENSVETHAFCWAWRSILQDTFGHQPYYLLARKDSKVCGIAPLFWVKSIIFGDSISSMPYLNDGGILANSNEAFLAILNKAEDLRKELNCKYVELRHREPLDGEKFQLHEKQHKIAMRLKLAADPDLVFKGFPAKLRSQIRRPTKDGLSATISSGDLEVEKAIDAFYLVFSEHMRDLGTPVYPKKLFKNTVQAFGSAAKIVNVWDGEQPVAGGITLGFADTTEIPWASSLRSHNKKSPNMLLYWEAIRQAATDGFKVFDFGRSNPDSGTLRFKKQWGAEPRPLYWYYKLDKSEVPDVNPNNSKFELMVKCWQKLPLPIANCLGPQITKWIP